MSIICSNRAKLESKIRIFQRGGARRLKVVTDFDYTMTKFKINGIQGFSCHKVMENSGILSEESFAKAKELHSFYYPKEIDLHLPLPEKEVYMTEWCTKAHEVLVSCGFTRAAIHKAVEDALRGNRLVFRERVDVFLREALAADIPVLIFSAGIADVLEHAVRTLIGTLKNITVLSNRCIYVSSEAAADVDVVLAGPGSDDNYGKGSDLVTSFEEPVIHVFNKKYSSFLHCSFFHPTVPAVIAEEGEEDEVVVTDGDAHNNVLLLGDSTGDVVMVEGMPTHECIKVGFLNDMVDQRLSLYLDIYDVVVLGDPDFHVPLSLLHMIISSASPSLPPPPPPPVL